MKIVALESDIIALKMMTKAIREAEPGAEIFAFRKSGEALDFVKKNAPDVVLIEVGGENGNGTDTAGEMAYYQGRVNLIFCAKDGSHAENAFRIHASGYIRKPVTATALRYEFANLRYQPAPSHEHSLHVLTFGNFEVYYQDEPVKLNARAKELFAYLVDRGGAMVSNNEIYGILFEDEPGHEENLKKIKKSLQDTFRALGLENVLTVQRGSLGVNPNAIECDLYAWRNGNSYARNAYFGEYMAQYSWAEYSKSEFFEEEENRKP